ncbi:YifB family Mg chelatase-like AAA ATPase [Stenotrophomonas oahuensis]|uniref:YifB family Mg chelatase-like AAA ATPase n=1 Tax=Stenotrophomonas oahuensis TaxID=3003271 RepID=A0ABY9YS71_9GAMM|nr:YifB family Mg chelatase-like AAA ATPase [Stenotrophomonas sp. A5586]WNH53786.1 YifB family Mg chelatase-like AAA ATPase [Stenotrophomonas sp. A5586]
MSLALVHSRARIGINAPAVRIEVMLSGGLPHTTLVGLPAAAVRESCDRVRAALLCAQFEYPNQRILINLAPADLPKEGGRFDLAIALGILGASGQIDPLLLNRYEFLGELALTGELRGVDGVLPAALAAAEDGRCLIVAAANGAEAGLAQDTDVRVGRTLLEVCASLQAHDLPRAVPDETIAAQVPDLSDVRGQPLARRALEVAAAGGHHLLLLGSPGCGKTLLASRLPGILPDATEAEALQTAVITSCSGNGIDTARWRQRPFRAPHHTASAVSLVGGGSYPRPGEISLAHNGVLFLDELPEWSRHTLEVLREPLESGHVNVARAARTDAFPARFQLVAAMNPCPCGWAGDRSGRCCCTPESIRRYRARISGPLLDRIDLHVQVPRLEPAELRSDAPLGEDSRSVRARVVATRDIQLRRAGKPNALLVPTELDKHCRLAEDDQYLLEAAVEQLQLSARSMHRILRVARTVADLAGCDNIETTHLAEAIGYRQVDRGIRS